MRRACACEGLRMSMSMCMCRVHVRVCRKEELHYYSDHKMAQNTYHHATHLHWLQVPTRDPPGCCHSCQPCEGTELEPPPPPTPPQGSYTNGATEAWRRAGHQLTLITLEKCNWKLPNFPGTSWVFAQGKDQGSWSNS